MNARRGLGLTLLGGLLLTAMWVSPPAGAEEAAADAAALQADGRELMNAVYSRHSQYPYVFEELSMLLVDRHGKRETRRLNRYSRRAPDSSLRVLLQFTFPRDLQGVALLATLHPDGRAQRQVFLPALGQYLIANRGQDASSRSRDDDNFLGTDFSVENLIGEDLTQYRYVRARDARIDGTDYYAVDVFGAADAVDGRSPIRRHYIMKNPMFITRTDHFDTMGRLVKQQTHHDLTPISGTTWRANMMLMDNRLQSHQTIIKIDRRVLSSDYVPEEVFTAEWIYANAPVVETGEAAEDSEPLVDDADTVEAGT